MSTFHDYEIKPDILKALDDMGFVTPSEIQTQALPVLLAGDKDFIGQAQTGTGKTAAFGIPLIQKIDPTSKSVQAIVLAPTRELAIQIGEEFNKIGKYKKLRCLTVYGGQDIGVQLRALKQGVHIVIGTPGRVVDHLHRRSLNLSQIRYFILDEADEMLDMGFLEEIEEILTHAGETRNIWLFSATLRREIREIANRFMKSPSEIRVQNKTATITNTEEHYYIVKNYHKFEALCRLIDHAKNMYAIVFCQTKSQTAEIAEKLSAKGYKADALHGDMNQSQREHVMRKFKSKGIRLLVATDVAARGIDVNDLTHVINYSLPMESESYIHRIGRTGRAGKSGIAISLISPDESGKLRRLEGTTRKRMTKSKIPGVQEIMEMNLDRSISEFEEALKNPSGFDRYFERWQGVVDKYSAGDIMRGFVTLLCREMLEKYEDDKELNVPDNFGQRSGGFRERSFEPRGEMVGLIIDAGTRENLQTGSLVGKICNLCGAEGRQIGKVFIHDDHTEFKVDAEIADRVVKKLSGIPFNGKRVTVQYADKKLQNLKPMMAKKFEPRPSESRFKDKPKYKKH